MKRYAGLARVSSREQEREGFSLDVQVDALRRYAEREGGKVDPLFRIAETASKRDERALANCCRMRERTLTSWPVYSSTRLTGPRGTFSITSIWRSSSPKR